MKSLSFICFEDDPKTFTQEEVDALVKEQKGDLFSQEDVNSFLAKEKRKTQEAQKNLAEQLAEVKKTAELSTDERNALTKEIEDLEKKYMTVEELNRQASEKETKKHETEISSLKDERNSWQSRFTMSTINATITRAAAANKAIASEQIAAMLLPTAKLAEKVDEAGKLTGKYEARVDFDDVDKDDKPITLNLTVSEAVKRMTELEKYGNLFEGGKIGGTGGAGGAAGKPIDLIKIAKTDPAQYRKLRNEKPELFEEI